MDDDEMDLKMRIRQFLTESPQLRNPTFDPAPYLIQVLKENSANQQAMQNKQTQLIDMENKARDLIDEVCSQNSSQFLQFLEIPTTYASSLENMKSNISVVKKKVKQTKALLMNTQKDIQQIHYNCVFNKQVYKELKKIQLRLQQYQTADLALKNNQYYLCALNLPFIQGQSILQSTLSSRLQTLRLRMISKAIDQLILFLFFSPKVVLPSSNVLIDRISSGNNDKDGITTMIGNWEQHEAFYKRYKLFKKADSHEYLTKIWQFSDLQRKQGKLGLVYDIVKGMIRIGRISEITSSLQLFGPKQISNVFLLLKYFRVKDEIQKKQTENNKEIRWFIDRCKEDQQDKVFMAATLNIIGVILRKIIIIQKIYDEFQQKQSPLNCGVIYRGILTQLKKLIGIIYFPNSKSVEEVPGETSEEQLNYQIKLKLKNISNYINYGHSVYLINRSLTIIQNNLLEIQEKQLGKSTSSGKNIVKKGAEMMTVYDQLFYNNFHIDFMSTMQQIFCKDGHSFIMESFQTIINYKPFKNDEIKFMKNYKSQDRKSIGEYIYLLSFMKALDQFFSENRMNKQKMYKYLLMCLVFFYLKLNYHVKNHLIPLSELLVIDQQRKTDRKLKKKQQEQKSQYQKILTELNIKQDQSQKIDSNLQNSISKNVVNYHNTDKLKVIQKQNQMLFNFSCLFFSIQAQKNTEDVAKYIVSINKLEPLNYEEQVQSKLNRVWDNLVDSEVSTKQYTAAALYKLFQLQNIITAKIYRETGQL